MKGELGVVCVILNLVTIWGCGRLTPEPHYPRGNRLAVSIE